MEKAGDLFKKIRDTKGTFHAKMGTIKDRTGMDLTEAEDIKKRQSLGREDPLEMGFPGGSAGEESACNAGDLGWIPGLRRSPGEGKGHTLQYSGLENPIDCAVHGVPKSQT